MAEDPTPHGQSTHVPQLPLGSPGRRRSDELSPREEEVLQLIADGLAPNEVAERLYISPRTVKNHLASAYSKMDKMIIPANVDPYLFLGGQPQVTIPTEARSGGAEPAE